MPHWLNDLVMLARLSLEFGRFLRKPLVVEEAVEILRHRLETREERFLRMVKQAIYGYPQSPYLQLLQAAGCQFEDLRALVNQDGLEGALSHLVQAGVYVTFDEFKGRSVAVRGGRRFVFDEADFNNPCLSPHFEVRSGGTRGPGTSVRTALPFIADLAVSTSLALHAHGLSESDHAIWLNGGVTPELVYAKLGHPPVAWFYQVDPLPMRANAGARYLAALSRMLGSRLPTPRFLDLQDPAGMATWLAGHIKDGKPICVTTYASSAVRICTAAREKGISLRGVCFITLGEPFTEAKQRAAEAAGARALVRYAFTEAGILGFACHTPECSDDLHFFSDCYGLIQRKRTVGDSGVSVDAFLYTSLLPTAPKILLNVESGDCGSLHRRGCGCALGALGLTTHLGRIRSFEKLSGEGMTFVQTDLLRVLEEFLPARFGGTSSDYQLLEWEGENGILRLFLIVSPRVGPLNEQRVRDSFLEEMEGGDTFKRLSAGVWRQAGTVEVKRQWPVATKAGKILPFHLIRDARAIVMTGPQQRVSDL